ncbi:hypothetical protein [Streptomyces sp. NPDC050287]|uniref:hypothetical protein n=1 Tax=Streptomyces sp. NPDC050287 TaxID=3365608 RepID=UPI0037A07E49
MIYEDGTTGLIEATGNVQPQLTQPGHFVSEERYLERLFVIEEARALYLADRKRADQERMHKDYASPGISTSRPSPRRPPPTAGTRC